MPLVLLCGIPCSGKTQRARELAEYIKSRGYDGPMQILEDDFGDSGKDHCYTDSRQEKILRAKHKSETERCLNEESVVILDSPNYIKGYRYELYCTSKHLHTPHCVVWCNTPVEVAREWNLSRDSSHSYSLKVFDALVMRFEAPDSRNRWDSPLFTLYPDDPLPGEAIFDALFHRKPPPPNKSTQSQPLSETSFLHELDRLTQEVVRGVVEAQGAGHLMLAGCPHKLEFSRPVTMAELRRLRKQFISYMKLNPVTEHSKITTQFVQYLNKTIL